MDLLACVSAGAGTVKSRRAQFLEIASPERSIRHRVASHCSASMGTDSLVIGEEE
jgi:hypothetical protein